MNKKEETQDLKPYFTNNIEKNKSDNECCKNNTNVESTKDSSDSATPYLDPTNNINVEMMKQLQIAKHEDEYTDASRRNSNTETSADGQTYNALTFDQKSTAKYINGNPAITIGSTFENSNAEKSLLNNSFNTMKFTWSIGKSMEQNKKIAKQAALKSSLSLKESKANSPTAGTEFKTIVPTFCTDVSSFYVFGGQSTQASTYNKPPQATTTAISENTAVAENLFDKTTSSIFDGAWKLEMSTKQNKLPKPFDLSSHKSIYSQNQLEINSPINTEFTVPKLSKAQQNETAFCVFGGKKRSSNIFDEQSMSQCIADPPKKTGISSAERLLNKTLLLTLFDNTLDFGIFMTPTSKFPVPNVAEISYPFRYIFTRQARLELARSSYELLKIKIDLYKYKDYKSATGLFEDAILLCPEHVPFYAVKCHHYMKLGMYKEALENAQKIVEHDSDSTYGYICLAKCYIALGHISGAIEGISKFRSPVDTKADNMLCALQEIEHLLELYIEIQRAISLDDYTDALACTDRFLELCPSNKVKATKATCFAMLGKFEQALQIADECLKTDVADPEALYAKGLCYHYNGQLPQAVESFKQVLAAFPLHWGAIDSLKKSNKFISLKDEGVEALKGGDYDKVIMLNKKLLTDKLNTKTNLKLYCSNAAMYLKLNKINLAIEACTAALKIDENCVDALRMRAKCYNKLGRYENSVKDLEKVGEVSKSVNNESGEDQKLAPNKEKTREMVSNVEHLVENQKFKEALNLTDFYLEDHKCDAELLYTKGLCYYYIGEYGRALEIFLQVLNIEPKHNKALLLLKKTSSLIRALGCSDELFNSGRWQEALYEFKKALEIDIGNLNLIIRVHCKIADIYLQLDQIYKAIFECDHVLTFDNNCVEALNKRAECYAEVMKYESAILDYEKICTIVDSEEIKQTIRITIVTLQKKKHYRQISNHAKILMERQETELALKLAEECLQFDSSDTHALYVKAMCLYFEDQYDEALDQFKQLLLLKPCHSMALKTTEVILSLKRLIERANNSGLTGKWQDALNNFTEALTIDMGNKNLRVRLYCKTAEMHLKLNQRLLAIEAYTNALKLDENCLDALRERAKCYTEDQSYLAALADYKKVSTIEENEETKQYTRNCIIALKEKFAYKEKSEQAMTLIGSQNVEELQIALKLAEDCLQFDSSDTNAHFVKGMCLYYKDEYEQALDQLQQVLILIPSHSTALTQIKMISLLKQIMEKAHNSLQSGRWHDALDSFTEALAIDTCNKHLQIKLHCKIADMHLKLRHIPRAIEAYTNALMLDENCLDALRERAKCYAEDQKYECAIEDYEKIYTIEKIEETKQYLRNCIIVLKEKIAYREKSEHAMTLIENQNVEELKIALKLAEECLQFSSSDTNARFVKGMYLYYKDEFEQALHQFQQVLILKPSHSTAFTVTKKISLLKRIMEKANNSLQNCRWQDALDNFTEALTIDTSNKNLSVRLYCRTAEMHLKLNQRLLAIEAYTNALKLDENCLDALRERAKCYTEDQRYVAALADYEKVSTIEENEESKQYTRNCIITLKQKIAYREKSKRAMTLIESQKVKELELALELALKLADECLQFNSSDTTARCVRGMYFYYKDQYEQALEQFQRVLVLKPSHSVALKQSEMIMQVKQTLDRGNYLLANGEFADALHHYSETLTVGMCSMNLRVKLYCEIASIHLKLNQKPQAIEAYTNALLVDAKHIEALRARANCYAEDHSYDSAIADYEKILATVESEDIKQSAASSIKTLKLKSGYLKKSQHAEILAWSQKTEDQELALQLAEECLQFDSSDTNALCVKGTCLYCKDEYEQALHQFEQVLLLQPSHSTALKEHKKITSLKLTIEEANISVLTERWQDALDHFNKAIKIDKCNTKLRVKLFCKMAEINLKLNNKPQAIEEYTNALMSDEKCLEALLGRAKCYKEDQQFESAIEDYETICSFVDKEEIIQAARNSITSLTERMTYRQKSQQARNLLSSGIPEDQESALEIAEECLRFDNSDINALYVKGTLLYHQNQYQEAQNLFQQILHLSPSNATALDASKKLTWLQSTIEKGNDLFIRGRWQEALDNYNTELKTYLDNGSLNCKLHCQKAMIYCKLSQTSQAIEAYSAALELDEKCLDALCERARCYIEVDNYKDALEDYKKMFTLARNSKIKEWARNSIINTEEKIAYKDKSELAETLMRSQNSEKLERALKLVEECLQFNSSDTKALCVKGSCYYYMGEYDQAIRQFERVQDFKPCHSEAITEEKKIKLLRRALDETKYSLIRQKWHDALDGYRKALIIGGDNRNLKIELFCKIGNTCLELNQKHLAVDEYTNALNVDMNCVEALRRRAQCLTDMGQYKKAVSDYEKLHAIEPCDETKKLMNEAAEKHFYYTFIHEKIEKGNKFYKQNNYTDALDAYREVVERYPENVEYYCKTFSCYIKLSMLKEAFVDAKKAVALDIKCDKVIDGIAGCYLALGDLTGAQRAIVKASNAGIDCTDDQRVLDSLQRHRGQALKYIDEQSYDRAISCIDKYLASSPFSSEAKLMKAECLVKLGKIDEAMEIADECIRSDRSDMEAVFVKGICLYYNDKLEQAMKYFKEVLRLSPDHSKALAAYKRAKLLDEKRTQGNIEFKKSQWRNALRLYEEALKIDATLLNINSKLHYNRAVVYAKLDQTQEAAEACIKALELDKNYVKALTLRAKCFIELEEYDSAVDDYEQLLKLDPNEEIERLLDEAKLSQQKKSKCKNYYDILGISKFASTPLITQAYKKLAMVHHPDRHMDRSEFERRRQKRRFQQIIEAYTVLTDPIQRSKYDIANFNSV